MRCPATSHTHTQHHWERSVDKVHPPRYVTFSVCCGFYWRIWVEPLLCGDRKPQGWQRWREWRVRHSVDRSITEDRDLCMDVYEVMWIAESMNWSLCISVHLLLATSTYMVLECLFCLHFPSPASSKQKHTWMNNDKVAILEPLLTSSLIAPYL